MLSATLLVLVVADAGVDKEMGAAPDQAAEIATSHHEKWDGSGYPKGLQGREIPRMERITAVVDVFSQRPYKEELPWGTCCEILAEGRGTYFDPDVLDAFEAHTEEIMNVQRRYADPV